MAAGERKKHEIKIPSDETNPDVVPTSVGECSEKREERSETECRGWSVPYEWFRSFLLETLKKLDLVMKQLQI